MCAICFGPRAVREVTGELQISGGLVGAEALGLVARAISNDPGFDPTVLLADTPRLRPWTTDPANSYGAGRTEMIAQTFNNTLSRYEFTGQQNIDAVLIGSRWTITNMTFSFPTDGSFYNNEGYPANTEPNQFVVFNAAQQNAVRYALDLVGQYTNLTFTEVTESASVHGDLRFGQTGFSGVPSAYANFPSSSPQSGDVWFGMTGQAFYDTPQIGNWGMATQLHEIGHALGLKHGHDNYTNVALNGVLGDPTGGGPRYGSVALPSNQDGQAWSLMTYRSNPGAAITFQGDGFNQPQTFMQNDIAALQHLYGANFGTNGGDTVYAWNATTGTMSINGVVKSAPTSNKILMTLWDGNGVDTYDLSNYASGVNVDLSPGAFSTFSAAQLVNHRPLSGGPAIAPGNVANALLYQGDLRSLIENAIGGAGNDRIVGNQADNTLTGGGGHDTVFGKAGSDTLTGGDGGDVLEGGAGADTLDGGADSDTASYAASAAGVRVSLLAGTAEFGDAAGDTLTGIENLAGSAFDDQLTGDAGVNVLSGGAGADELDGGLGTDTADYSASNSGVTVRLFAGSGLGGHAAGDTLISIERVIGSIYGDSLIGSDLLSGDELEGGDGHDFLDGRLGNDVLEGGLGNDTLYGQAGLDSLFGGVGNDVLRGGAGADIIDGGDGFDTADYGNGGSGVTVRLWNGTGAGADAAGDTYFSIERVVGSAFGDSLIGSDTAAGDTLEGGGGADYLSGLGGSDILDGGLGIDTLLGGLGNDLLRGGAGGDVIDGGAGTDTADYSTSGSGVTIRLWNGVHEGGDALGDTLTSIERVIGSIYGDTLVGSDTVAGDTLEGGAGNDVLDGRDGADVLDGGAGTDTLSGGAGNDVLRGGAGADAMDGGDGLDAVDYSTATSGVTVRLFNGTGAGGDAAGDTFVSIERVIGSAYGDSLIGADTGTGDTLEGAAGNDYLSGLAGADVVDGGLGTDTLLGGSGDDLLRGGAGADVLDGGAGTDTADYSTSAGGVTIRLYNGIHAGADAAGDTLTSIERVVGSIYGDSLIGSDTAAGDVLEGGAGNDYLAGRDGTDVLRAGTGNDSLFGGAGADTFAFRAGDTGSKTIGDFSLAGGDVIEFATNLFVDFADVMTSTTDDGLGNTVISRAGVSITLTGVLKAQLTSGDFQFVAPAPIQPQDKDAPLTLPDLLSDDPLILPASFGPLTKGHDDALILPPLDDGLDPLILPTGLETKILADDAPVICPPGETGLPSIRPDFDLLEMGLSNFDGRDPHRFLMEPRFLDWVA